jgi:uncharacterized protein (TIGR03437 family)
MVRSAARSLGFLVVLLLASGVASAQIGCVYQLSPASATLSHQGYLDEVSGYARVDVSTSPGCVWTATTPYGWIRLGASGGVGPGSVIYTAEPNPASIIRTGVIYIAGQTHNVTQAGSTPGCSFTFTLSPAGVLPAAGATVTLNIATVASCFWSAESAPAWVEYLESPSGIGSGGFRFRVQPNPGVARSGAMSISGQSIQLEQAGSPCAYSLAPTTQAIAAAGGVGTIAVTTGPGCPWTATSSATWVTVRIGAASNGPGQVSYSVAANSSTASRTATVTVGGQIHTVTQAGASCTYTLAPPTQTVAAAGGVATVAVTSAAGCAWTATSSAAWLTITAGASGAGAGQVTYSAAANTTASSRTATVTVGGQVHTVTQAAPAPEISSGGVVNSVDFTASFAPGAPIAIFGRNLASRVVEGGAPPLARGLDGTSVEAVAGGVTVVLPLYFVSPGQVNAQLPFEIADARATIRVRTSAGVSAEAAISLSPAAPRILTTPAGGAGEAALLHADYSAVSAASPAQPGEWLVVYLAGMGAVTPPVASGAPAGDGVSAPLNRTTASVQVLVGGEPAEVAYAGLAPNWVGLYQVNFRTPAGAAPGDATLVVVCGAGRSQEQVRFRIAAGR